MRKFSLFFLFILITFSSEAQNKCRLVGKVVDRPKSSVLFLVKSGDDLRLKRIEIPIVNGAFECEFEYSDDMEYSLNFKEEVLSGSWRYIPFFPKKNGVVSFVLYPKEKFESNVINGDPEKQNRDNYTKLMMKYSIALDSINKIRDGQLTKKGQELYDKIGKESNQKVRDSLLNIYNNGLEDESLFTKEYFERRKEVNAIAMKMCASELEFISKNSSLLSYTKLKELYSSIYSNMDMNVCDKIFYTTYEKKFPNHPYTKEIREAIKSRNIKVGGKYVDFEAPDVNGKMHKLSTEIAGKIAIIDLWASWCGPCRSHSIDLIPLYEKYKNQGFTVVGVAREENQDDMVRSIKKDGYKWLNLLELKDRANIWNKYGAGNAGGRIVLVDRDGTILAISPTTKEIEQIIIEKLEK